MTGTLEGDNVKFRSYYRALGNGISYTFSGKVSGDSMSGNIHMGEYLTATFTAKKHVYSEMKSPIIIPPLSS